jgi:hypothetical protein
VKFDCSDMPELSASQYRASHQNSRPVQKVVVGLVTPVNRMRGDPPKKEIYKFSDERQETTSTLNNGHRSTVL